MNNGRWAAVSWKRLKQLKLNAPIPAEWTQFEQNFMTTYKKAQEEARELLKKGERDAAVKLLNDTANAIWKEAAALLNL